MELAPAYLAPPTGIRHKVITGDNFSRRDPQDGPYGIFISYVNENVHRSTDMSSYQRLWGRASPFVNMLLWGSSDQRRQAQSELTLINDEINSQNKNLNRRIGTGCIEVQNLFNAGAQLMLAVRDVMYYRSTARYEDVRDFIWERIQNRNYPKAWAVTRERFKTYLTKFKNTLQGSTSLDIEDGAYHETQLNVQSDLRAKLNTSPSRPRPTNRITRSSAKQSRENPQASQLQPRPARTSSAKIVEGQRTPAVLGETHRVTKTEYREPARRRDRDTLR